MLSRSFYPFSPTPPPTRFQHTSPYMIQICVLPCSWSCFLTVFDRKMFLWKDVVFNIELLLGPKCDNALFDSKTLVVVSIRRAHNRSEAGGGAPWSWGWRRCERDALRGEATRRRGGLERSIACAFGLVFSYDCGCGKDWPLIGCRVLSNHDALEDVDVFCEGFWKGLSQQLEVLAF